MGKTRQQKAKEYAEKYKDIPILFEDRLDYMCDFYNLSEAKMQEIYTARNNMIRNMQYIDLKVVVLYEEPEGAQRPRHVVTKSNFNKLAKISDFVRVYSPNAASDSQYMRRLVGQELDGLDQFIYTPCQASYNAYLKTPSHYSINNVFLAEIGLDRPGLNKPDWDNIGKKYCDMYNSNVWLDDTLVVDGEVHKYFSILPRVEINIRYLNCVYNKYQYNSIKKKIGDRELHYINNKGELI